MELLDSHGIDPKVWAERGAWRYDQGEAVKVKEAYERWFAPKGRKKEDNEINPGTVTKIVNQSGGLVMPKHAPPGFLSIPPQLRPDRPVMLEPREVWHYHGPLEGDWPTFPLAAGSAAGKPLPRRRVLYGLAAEAHIRRGKPEADDYDLETGLGRHKGISLDVVHRHAPEAAKYVLLGSGKRLDLHPRALKLLRQKERAFFVLEGTLKNDAVLSAGEAVFSVPSVTLWNPAELRAFARFLRRLRPREVFVVPDADWARNTLVEQQALFVRSLLRNCGISAYIAAPPVKDLQQECLCKPVGRFLNGACVECGGFAKAVDDHLAGGGTIDGLAIRQYEVPPSILELKWGHRNTTKRAIKAARELILHANRMGRHFRTLGALGKIMDVDKRWVPDTLYDLERLGVIAIGGDLEVKTVEWNGIKVSEWEERPTVAIDPEFRAWEEPNILLGDFWQRETRKLDEANVKLQRDVTEIKRLVEKLVPEA